MLQDGSVESYEIYQSLNQTQKEAVLQEQYEMDNDMGSYGDGTLETSKANLLILLSDAKKGQKYAKGGRTDVNKDVTSTLSRLQPYLDEYTMRKYGFKANPEEIFVEYSKRPDGSAQITAVTIDSPSRKQSKKIFVDDIFETYARGGKMPKPYPMKEEIIVS
jgi:hypothetical protein